MEYGYYIETTSGQETWFAEGCICCRMSTSGLHESHCPYRAKIAEIREYLKEIHDREHYELSGRTERDIQSS